MNIEEKYQEKCATPSDIYQHLPTLRKYAEQCQTVTEMGVRTVVSTWALLAGLRDARQKNGGIPRLISVDLAAPEKHGGNLAEVEAAAADGLIEFDFIEGDTRTLQLPECDLLFIDTWHVYEQLKVELERHAPKAKKFIILHDTETFGERGETEGHRGLRPALDEFLASEEGRHWFVLEHFANCNGLTVLERRA